MSLAALKATIPLVDLASVDPGDETELAVAINKVAAAILEVEALGGGAPLDVIKPSELAVALTNMGHDPTKPLILGLVG